MSMRRFTISACATCAVAFGVIAASAQTSVAASGADAIEYRKEVYHATGGHMSAMKLILQGKAGRAEDLVPHAEAMVRLSMIGLHIFPEGSGPEAGKTRAKAEIWTDTAKFKEAQERWITKAETLLAVAKTGDMKKAFAAFGDMGKNGCGGCHKPFRGPKQ